VNWEYPNPLMEENTSLKIDQVTYFKNLLETTSIHQKAQTAVTASENVWSTKINGLPDSIDQTRPSKSYREEDAAEWSEAFMKEYMGFKELGLFKMVQIEKEMKLMGMTTLMEC
jgi:hypothetical protein